jgi:hypothetical protein
MLHHRLIPTVQALISLNGHPFWGNEAGALPPFHGFVTPTTRMK